MQRKHEKNAVYKSFLVFYFSLYFLLWCINKTLLNQTYYIFMFDIGNKTLKFLPRRFETLLTLLCKILNQRHRPWKESNGIAMTTTHCSFKQLRLFLRC